MHLKRTITIALGFAAAAAWFSAAMTPGLPPLRTTRRGSPLDARGTELAHEIDRLHERLRPDVAPRAAVRNPFTFRASRRPPPVDPPRDVVETPSPLRPAAPPALSLAGLAEDPGPDGPIRTAIVTGGGQVFLVKPGDTLADGGVSYRVGAVSADGVVLTNTADGSALRLTLK